MSGRTTDHRVLALVLAALLGCDPDAGPAAPDAGAAALQSPPPPARTRTRTMHLGAAAFVADGGLGVPSQYGFLEATAPTTAVAAVPLPAGTYLARLTVHYIVSDGTGGPPPPVRPGLRRMNPVTGEIAPVWLGALDGTGGALEAQSAAIGEPMLATDWYWVELQMAGRFNRVYDAVLEYVEPGEVIEGAAP